MFHYYFDMKCLKLSLLLIIILVISFSSCTINDVPINNKDINYYDDIFNFSSLIEKQNKENFGFAISSDPHFFSKNSNSVASIKILQILEKYFEEGRIKAFFCLGDFFDNGGKRQNWIEFISLKNKYAPTLPIFSVIGNHDIYFGGKKYWISFFRNLYNIYKNDAFQRYVLTNSLLNSVNQTKYYFIYGPTSFVWHYSYDFFHFIGLNLPWGYFNMSEKEKNWVKNEIEKISKQDFLVILSHSFFYASGYKDLTGKWFDNQGNINNIAPIFLDKADMVISGHNHYMELIEHDNIYWVIIGAMGGKPDPDPIYISKGSKWFLKDVHGFFFIEKSNNRIILSFKDYNDNTLYSISIFISNLSN